MQDGMVFFEQKLQIHRKKVKKYLFLEFCAEFWVFFSFTHETGGRKHRYTGTDRMHIYIIDSESGDL